MPLVNPFEGEFKNVAISIGAHDPLNKYGEQEGRKSPDLEFPSYNTVCDVKTLTVDPRREPTFQPILDAREGMWEAHGWIVRHADGSRTILNKRAISEDLYDNTSVGTQVESHFKKANKQVKSYKAAMSNSDARGLIVLCNLDNRILPPSSLGWCCERAWRGAGWASGQSGAGRYSSIHGAIVMTHGLPSRSPGLNKKEGEVWIEIDRNGGYVDHDLYLSLRNAWRAHLKAEHGRKIFVLLDTDALKHRYYI